MWLLGVQDDIGVGFAPVALLEDFYRSLDHFQYYGSRFLVEVRYRLPQMHFELQTDIVDSSGSYYIRCGI